MIKTILSISILVLDALIWAYSNSILKKLETTKQRWKTMVDIYSNQLTFCFTLLRYCLTIPEDVWLMHFGLLGILNGRKWGGHFVTFLAWHVYIIPVLCLISLKVFSLKNNRGNVYIRWLFVLWLPLTLNLCNKKNALFVDTYKKERFMLQTQKEKLR